MKLAWLTLGLLAVPAFAGCIEPATIDDANTDSAMAEGMSASWAKALPDIIAGVEHVAKADIPTGAGIWIYGDFAYVSGRSTGMHIVDISDPASPVHVSSVEGEFYSRDVDFLHYPDNRLVAVNAGEGQGMHFVDVTDPAKPEVIANLDLDGSTHNVAVLPGTMLVFNSASDGAGGKMEVVDATDPANPVKVAEYGDHGCHDITFFQGEGKERLYCAGIERTEIWDIADPLNGVLISSFTNPFVSAVGAVAGRDGGLTPGLHHLAMVNEDASVLIVGDEYTGGLGPGCGVNAAGESTPLGALWFYDISGDNEKAPVEMGRFSPLAPVENHAQSQATSCTAHFGQLIPGTELIAMSWYAAGVILIDFSNPAAPEQVDQWNLGTNTWDVRYANGYLFTGDIARGLDVLTFV